MAERTYHKKIEEADVKKLIRDKYEQEKVKRELNQAAEIVVQRINDKLRGTEFPIRPLKVGKKLVPNKEESQQQNIIVDSEAEGINTFGNQQDIEDQVDLLIQQATNHENLA